MDRVYSCINNIEIALLQHNVILMTNKFAPTEFNDYEYKQKQLVFYSYIQQNRL